MIAIYVLLFFFPIFGLLRCTMVFTEVMDNWVSLQSLGRYRHGHRSGYTLVI